MYMQICMQEHTTTPLKGFQNLLQAALGMTTGELNQPGDKQRLWNTFHMVRGWKKMLSAITTETNALPEKSCESSNIHRE